MKKASTLSLEQMVESLQQEKEALAQQVKRLIRAEGKLYEYQEELDAQLKEYEQLYDFNRRLNRLHDLQSILAETVSYVIDHVGFERAICFARDEESQSYQVFALEGYYDPAEKAAVTSITLPLSSPCLSSLFAGCDYLVCKTDRHHKTSCRAESQEMILFQADGSDRRLAELGSSFLMKDYLIYPLGSPALPQALLVVGNCENATFYRKVDGQRGTVLALGNLAGVVSWLIEHRASEQRYRQLSEELERRVQEAVDELRQKDKLLILQGRHAVMGEMISNIAHQWRQPLNVLGLVLQELQLTQHKQGLNAEEVDSFVKRSLAIIRQMSRTIDSFRHFFKPDREKVEFRVRECLENTLTILEGSFRMQGIAPTLEAVGDPTVDGYPNEFIQVLLNILINAREALTARKPAAPQILVRLFSEGDRTVVTVADNGGGIPEEIIDRIFDPYFTTKGPEQGTGIGLFMCKTIVEKNMGGRISVRNVGEGAEFRIEV
ncbi:HAMP domain-containing sensor histidine kinase [Geomonas sp.]|uniref:sensor histidine kinase n=1 Tax=Geomonas sp. TaxID=2651584 RepID=UPI002B4A3576|nr:HAMP domain-containing sensor histidine kinase [Geomonas sp.]HJV36461.1 HAMP domain-containing sensor histidine kinase [Geomonas sp.]